MMLHPKRLPEGTCRSKGVDHRAGISLLEALISIAVLGVGIISLACLFPIGLVRLRDAQRQARSAYLVQSAGSDLSARALLSRATFLDARMSPWYRTQPSGPYDPWIQDTPSYGGDWLAGGAYRGWGGLGVAPNTQSAMLGSPFMPGPGLPIAYDPLWRSQTLGGLGGGSGYYLGDQFEARFGYGIDFLRNDPNDGGPASAWGLQRLTNFSPTTATSQLAILSTFVSPEDKVWQEPTGTYQDFSDPTAPAPAENPSSVLPDLGNVALSTNDWTVSDWRYTWLLTGQRTDSSGGSTYDSNIVILENRPFAIDPVGESYHVVGERVVEAVFGYSGSIAGGGDVGYGSGSNKVIVLLWPIGQPDLVVKPGSWVADVTYERQAGVASTRFPNSPGSAQRCYWYRVTMAGTVTSVVGTSYRFSTLPGPYRYMVVHVDSPLQVRTLLTMRNGVVEPYAVNSALVSPHVVNVVPRTFVVP